MANFQWFGKAHAFVYHHSQGWIGANLGVQMVLMYTIGAKTGQTRMVPLQYYSGAPDGILVLASNNGQTKLPAWYYNLQANPEIDIRVGREKRHVRAEELSPERCTEVWPAMRRQNPKIDNFAAKASRPLPIMLLRELEVSGGWSG
jgi:deazaflavin-dependent oxidoreductase (nitroreductase family)